MSEIQHQLAHGVLSLIRKANGTDTKLTYQTVAVKLKRPENHARAIASACDLLDASAAFANIPLLALIKVRDASGEINPDAFVKGSPKGLREIVIGRSKAHTFTEHDFDTIKISLTSLTGYGNHAAWKEVNRRMEGNLQFQQLWSLSIPQDQDALDDIGSDHPEKTPYTGTRYARDDKVRKEVLTQAQGECELCGEPGFERPNGSKYLEAHHILALADDGADKVTNVIALCANHHREAHYGKARKRLEQEMIAKIAKRPTARPAKKK